MTQSSFVTNFTFDIEKPLWPSKPSHGLTPIYPRKLLKVMWKSPLINTYRKWFVCLFLGLKGENLPLYRLWIINVPHAFCRCEYWGEVPYPNMQVDTGPFYLKTRALKKPVFFVLSRVRLTSLYPPATCRVFLKLENRLNS